MDFNEFKERVRSENNITDVIGRYVSLKRSGSYYKGLCPFHGEKTPSFYVMPDDQYFYCYGCHKGGDVFTFLCDHDSLEFSEALEELASNAGLEMPEKFDGSRDRNQAKKGLKGRLFSMYKDAAQYYYDMLHGEQGKRAYEYLKNRGISANMMTAFGLGYAPGGNDSLLSTLKEKGYSDEELKESGLFSYKTGRPRDYFYNRVIFPIMNKSSRVIAFGARVLDDSKPKYINSPETLIYSKKDNLYGVHRAIRARNNRIILVEGYMDVISVQQAGFTETAASLGTSLTEEQARLIAGLAGKVYLIYDSDSAGTAAMLRAIPILRAVGLFVNVVDMSPFKDPDELIKSEGAVGFEKRIEKAENAFFFEIKELSKEFNLNDPSERAVFEAKTAERIASFDNHFEREQFIETISTRFAVDIHLLKNEVSRIGNLKDSGTGVKYRVRTSHRLDSGKGDEKRELPADEKNILCSLLRSPEYYDAVIKYISPDMFSAGIMEELAKITFAGAKGGGVTVAEIMDRFAGEENDFIGKVFSDENYELSGEEDKKRFLSESVISLLKRHTDTLLSECTVDMQEEYRRLTLKRKEIDKTESIFN